MFGQEISRDSAQAALGSRFDMTDKEISEAKEKQGHKAVFMGTECVDDIL